MSQNSNLNAAWKQAKDALNTGFFKALKPVLANFKTTDWPTLAALNDVQHRAENAGVQFVEADASIAHYEVFIHETNTVPTRDNWHDLFNAFAWLTFPKAKAALNQAHIQHIDNGGADALKSRSSARDALTLFDESGIIVVSHSRALLELIPAFDWHALFVQQRAAVKRQMLFIPFGHALMEKMLAPYLGMVAKVILVEVEPDFFNLDQAVQCAWCDAEVARLVAETTIFSAPKNLLPLPFLGVPGWDARNEDEAFYANTNYFRSGSRAWSFSRNSSNDTGLEI